MTSTPSLDTIAGQVEQVRTQLDQLADRLARDYTDVSTESMRSYVRAESDRFSNARVHAFIPVLVERAVRERLNTAA